MTTPPDGEYLMVIGLTNGKSLTVSSEPGLGQVELPAGVLLGIAVSGHEGETVDVTHGADHVAIWPSPLMGGHRAELGRNEGSRCLGDSR